MALTAINQGADATYLTVNQFYQALKGTATDSYTLKNASDAAYALTVWNTGTGGGLRVRNAADSANLLIVGETYTEIVNDFKASALAMTGGVMGSSPYQPRVKIVETGSAATPLQNYTAYAPHTVAIMAADNPVHTYLWIESIDDTFVAASGAEAVGSDLKRARVNPAIYVQHFGLRDNGYDSSAVTIVEWGQSNNISLTRTVYSNADVAGASTLRPSSIDDSNITWSRTAGFAVESYGDGGTTIIDTQAREYGLGMAMGIGPLSTTAGDNSGTREYADGLRVYPYNGGVGVGTGVLTSDSGTATAGAATTLTDSGKVWTVNAWAGYVVRTTGGTGSGQERVIVSNTATVLTVATWTTNPDATTTYAIDTYQDQRAALRVVGVTSAPSYYLNKYDSWRVMLDGKQTMATLRATSATPGAAPLYLRMLGRTNAARYSGELQFGYQATDTGTTGAPSTELIYAAVGGLLSSSSGNSTGGIVLSTRRGTGEANLTEAVSIQATGDMTLNAAIEHKRSGLTLSNGLNSNIALSSGSGSFLVIAGPSAGFSIGGFTPPTTGCKEITIQNGVAQNMTIVNEDASSTEAWRIATNTGADIVQSGVSSVTLIYDLGGTNRWIVKATQA